MRICAAIILASLLAACTSPEVAEEPLKPRTGAWLVSLDLGDDRLPFELELNNEEGDWGAVVSNAEERIPVDDVEVVADSFRMRMPLFDSEFEGRFTSDTTITGNWTNYLKGADYQIPFSAEAGNSARFRSNASTVDVSGSWEVRFSPDTEDEYPAIGLFRVMGSELTGTFITETGDYRYLEGVMSDDSLYLSCFDGSHAFFFRAEANGDSLSGVFRSGTHWSEPWVAVRNDAAQLSHPDSLTHLKEGYEMLDFTFEDINGRTVGPKEPDYQGKVLAIQVMGTWCPNCVDETRLLTEIHDSLNDSGFEVIALAFEKHRDKSQAGEALNKFRSELGVSYSMVHAGYSSKDSAAAALPFLNHVMSYPTCIIIDRKGVVRKIHTGFYGPGTGDRYTVYRREFTDFIRDLVMES